jgi:hypothetical protein
MRLTLTFLAHVTDKTSGSEVFPPKSLNGRSATDDLLENYLDAVLVDAGVTGGTVRIFTENDKVTLEVLYWIPNDTSELLIDRLRADTIAQLDDGIGEGGFDVNVGDVELAIVAETESPISVEMVDDGKNVPGPPRIAIAARDGNLSALASAIESNAAEIDRPHQGYSGLHLAILYGHPEAVRILLTAGANPNLVEPQGSTPLQLCALSNSLEDEQSRQVAKMLLDAGADPSNVASNGETAKSYAESRKKHRTAELL